MRMVIAVQAVCTPSASARPSRTRSTREYAFPSSMRAASIPPMQERHRTHRASRSIVFIARRFFRGTMLPVLCFAALASAALPPIPSPTLREVAGNKIFIGSAVNYAYLSGQGTASQVPLTFEYPITHRQAVFTRLGVLSFVALFAGHAVQLVPVFLPSPYVLGPQEHMCVPGPVCVHT